MGVDNARNSRNTAAQLLGDLQVFDAIVADGTHVDRRGEPKMQNLRRHIGGLEIEHVRREGRRQHSP